MTRPTGDEDRAERSGLPERIAVLVTFLPFAWKAWTYLSLSSFVPLAAFAALLLTVVLGMVRGGRAERRAVRIWLGSLVAWGVARLLLMGAIAAADLDEAHLRSQLTLSFAAVSLVAVAVGAGLWRRYGAPTRG
jgi:hypothetical protein